MLSTPGDGIGLKIARPGDVACDSGDMVVVPTTAPMHTHEGENLYDPCGDYTFEIEVTFSADALPPSTCGSSTFVGVALYDPTIPGQLTAADWPRATGLVQSMSSGNNSGLQPGVGEVVFRSNDADAGVNATAAPGLFETVASGLPLAAGRYLFRSYFCAPSAKHDAFSVRALDDSDALVSLSPLMSLSMPPNTTVGPLPQACAARPSPLPVPGVPLVFGTSQAALKVTAVRIYEGCP